MAGRSSVLLIGDAQLRDVAARALPGAEILFARHPLAGIWQLGRAPNAHVVISAGAGGSVISAIRAIRRIAPRVRLIVSCAPVAEPFMPAAVLAGADDYILEPVAAEELTQALQWQDRVIAGPAALEPGFDEILELSHALRRISDGPERTIERLAAIARRLFSARGVAIQIDGLSCIAGSVEQIVLEAPILRDGVALGRIALAPHEKGAYDSAAAARLTEFAVLVDAYVSQSRDREQWQRLACTDELTGLHNRRYFEQTFDELLVRATSQRLRVTLFLFDIDGFKAYNDRLGHLVGDDLLREIAVLLKTCCRESDLVARIGGDEFAVVVWDAEEPRVPGSAHPTEPIALTARFTQMLERHEFRCLGKDAPGHVTISGGLASCPWDGTNRVTLMHAADNALFIAKRSGRNQIALTPEARFADRVRPPDTPPTVDPNSEAP